MRKLIWVASGLLVGLICAGIISEVQASRNSAGTMSGVNGPFVSGQVIGSSLLNNRYSDIESEITNSLDRSGRGGMLAALRGIDGTLAAPAFSWTSETGSGLFRNGASDVRMSISGSLRENWTSTGVAVTGTLSSTSDFAVNTNKFTVAATSGNTVVAGTLGVTGAATLSTAVASTSLAVGGANPGTWTTNGSDIFLNAGAAASGITFRANGAGSSTGEVSTSASGLKIGSSGTAISASIRGTASLTGGSIAANGVQVASVTVTGATTGGECSAGSSVAQPGGLIQYCVITGANTCQYTLANYTTGAISSNSATVSCRVWQP